MSDIIGLLFPFFGLIFLGAFLARITRQPIEALGWMNTFVIYVALPALFFQILAQTPIERLGEWRFILTVIGATYFVFTLIFLTSLVLSRSGIAESTIKALSASYGNIGYMGPGLALLVFGPEAAVPLALIFCFENAVHFAVAPMMMAIAKDEKAAPLKLAADVVLKILLHPFIIATILGVAAAWFQFEPPLPVDRLLEYLAQAAAPCALFAMGVTLALRPLKRVPHDLGWIAGAKLILHPLICYLALTIAGDFDPVWVHTAVLLAALPTATNVYVIAQQYEVWVERASASVLITTVLSVVTMTVVLYLIQSGLFS